MHPYQVEVEAHPTPEDVQCLDDRLYEYKQLPENLSRKGFVPIRG
jgi:hypothetical protein